MFKLQSRSVIRGASVALACLATPVVAQDRTALVIANSAYPADTALPDIRRSALKVSEQLLGLGFVVNRLENPSAADMQTALTELQAAEGVSLLYYAGRTTSAGDASFFTPVNGSAAVPIDPMVSGPSEATRIVMIDMCHDIELAEQEGDDDDDFLEGEDDDPDEIVPLAEALARAVDDADNLLFASSVEPGEGCEVGGNQTLTDLLLDRMNVPGLDVAQFDPSLIEVAEGAAPVDEVLWFGSTLQEPFIFRTATSDVRLTAENYATLDKLSPAAREQMIAMWKSAGIAVDVAGAADIAPTNLAPVATTANTVVLVAPVRPVSTATVIAPLAPRPSAGISSGTTTLAPATSGGVTLVAGGGAAPAPAVFRPTPGENGLPAPSILVGFVTEEAPAPDVAPEVDDSPVAGTGLSYDDLEARNAMRNGNPEMFESLVASGAFDPPSDQLARAIQTELARMNCYRSGIDGIWGPGSRRSVTAYYDQISGSTPSQDPDPRIFRAIIERDDVRCPDPVVAAPAPRRATTTQAAPRRATTTQAAPRRQAAPAPAPAAPAAPARRTIQQSTGTGSFR